MKTYLEKLKLLTVKEYLKNKDFIKKIEKNWLLENNTGSGKIAYVSGKSGEVLFTDKVPKDVYIRPVGIVKGMAGPTYVTVKLYRRLWTRYKTGYYLSDAVIEKFVPEKEINFETQINEWLDNWMYAPEQVDTQRYNTVSLSLTNSTLDKCEFFLSKKSRTCMDESPLLRLKITAGGTLIVESLDKSGIVASRLGEIEF